MVRFGSTEWLNRSAVGSVEPNRTTGTSSRRDVLRGIAGGVAAAALPSSAFALDVLTDDAVPDLRILSGVGGNVVALGTKEGQIVVDSGDAESSKVVLSTLRTFGVPV